MELRKLIADYLRKAKMLQVATAKNNSALVVFATKLPQAFMFDLMK